ncbi:MAG: RAD55 family ATPase [Archaeoglobaceae archaeon]|nr:RAD55 family ATPase [Archaeoglobaceae archaeon]MDW8118333.1 RAD55 family ATPase [Archaeoglobaceae archaeon]
MKIVKVKYLKLTVLIVIVMMEQTLLLKRNVVPTGIALLDKRLDGGLPAGSFVCLYADPIAMPEAFLYQFATVNKSIYITTNRPAKFILRDMQLMRLDTKNVQFIDAFTEYYINEYGQFVVEDRYRNKEIFDFVSETLDQANDKEAAIIVDSISFFLSLDVEWGLKDWILNKLYSKSKESENNVYVYLIKNLHPLSVVYKVLDLSDVVINVESERVGERIVSKFALPKIRGRRPISEYFRFNIEEGVQVDTSRDIA